MKYLLFFILTVLISINSKAQSNDSTAILNRKGKFYWNNLESIYTAESIYYYGIDFYEFILYNPQKVGTESEIEKYFGPWTADFQENNLPFFLYKKLKIKTVPKLNNVQFRYKDKQVPWVKYDKEDRGFNHIQKSIDDYKLEEESGIGLVVIVDNFNKKEEKCYLDFVFFDISTRKELLRYSTFGYAEGMGMTKHWSESLNSAWLHFNIEFTSFYKKHKKGKN